MHELVLTPRFERAFRRLVSKNPALQTRLEQALRRMAAGVTDSRLKTHHLSGRLAGLHACSAGYDCRIVFAKDKHPKTGAEVLILVNIGSHDEVY
jgi:mRNA-degrading endonuclease YafQ of YafQ-DinJ toxin-antitoxin module